MTRRDPSAAAASTHTSTTAIPNILTSPLPTHCSVFHPHTHTHNTVTRRIEEKRTHTHVDALGCVEKKRRYYVWHKSWHMRFLTNLSTVIYTRGDDDRFPSRCGNNCRRWQRLCRMSVRRVRMKEFHLHGFFSECVYCRWGKGWLINNSKNVFRCRVQKKNNNNNNRWTGERRRTSFRTYYNFTTQ